MFEASTKMEKAYRFSRFDLDNPLSTCSPHPILLEEQNWATCEHYVQTKSLRAAKHADLIDRLATGAEAFAYAKPWYRLKIANYKAVAPVLMKRALYTKVQMYEDVREALLATGEQLIAEGSQYDYFWGIGRDLRGHNHLGKAWMDIREKLHQEANT